MCALVIYLITVAVPYLCFFSVSLCVIISFFVSVGQVISFSHAIECMYCTLVLALCSKLAQHCKRMMLMMIMSVS